MVIQPPNTSSQSSGLLPTPSRRSNVASSDSFVGRSFYPVPYPLITVLEGSQLSDLISWDISVSPKHLKLKLEWSISTNDRDASLSFDIIPNNILQAIKFYNVSQPSWSTSSGKNKLSSKIEWQISSPNSKLSSSQSTIANFISSSTKSANLSTPVSQNLKNLSDSGFGSLNSNSNSNCSHGDSYNWRRSVNLPRNPIFDSPRYASRRYDIYTTPKCKDDKASNNFTKNSSINPSSSEKSPLPVVAQEVNSVNMKSDTLPNQGKTPNHRIENYEKNPIACRDSNPLVPSSLSLDSNVSSPQEVKPSSKPVSSKSQKKSTKRCTESNNPISGQDSKPLAPASVPSNISPTDDVSNEIPSTSDLLSSHSYDDIPEPPIDFPKTFLKPPKPLPIVGDSFLNPKTAAQFMNISGSCRLCGKTVSSHLIDHHLILCSGLDRQPLENFSKFATKEFSMKKNKVVEASLLYCKFEMNDATLPNKFFKNVNRYRSFVLKLEDLSKELTDRAFKKLKLSPKLESFNILKYQP